MAAATGSTPPRSARRASLEQEYALAQRHALGRARGDFLSFCHYVRPDWEPNAHHKVICRVLERWGRGEIPYLVITAPPRHGKSEIMSRMLPAYLFGRHEHTRVMAASYAATLASDFNRDVQRIMTSDEYKEVFDHVHLNERNIRTVANGSWLRNNEMFEVVGTDMYYKCAGVEGALTGRGGNKLLLDDFLKDWKDAHSKVTLDAQWDWLRSVFLTRRAKGGSFAATVTRWTHDDLIGRFIKLMEGMGRLDQVLQLRFPAIQDRDPTWYDPREPGEALWPSMFPLEMLHETRDIVGERIFEALYQQNPTVAEGDIVKRDWWRWYNAATRPASFDRIDISCDLTFDDDNKNDFVVMQVWGKLGADKYLLHQVRDRMSFVKTVDILLQLVRDHRPNGILVEKAANGAAVISMLRRKVAGIVPCHPGSRSKATRLEAAAPQIQAGNCHLPEDERWAYSYVEEFAEFPNGKNDDQVDATSQYLNHVGKQVSYDFLPMGVGKKSQWAGL